jgi:hypothetical protein
MAPPPTATKSRDRRVSIDEDPEKDAISSIIEGTVIRDRALVDWRSSMVEVAEGMIEGEGKQHGFPTDKLRHGARRPKPWTD